MKIEDLEYYNPTSLAEASVLLFQLKGDARIIAGGTDVLADLKQGLIITKNLVSLDRINELKEISHDKEGLWIGALVSPNQIANSSIISKKIPGLADAGGSMAGNQIRNLATIGGNLCSAVPSADLPPILLAVDAELLVAKHNSERKIPIRKFYVGPRKTVLTQGEIVAVIHIPAPMRYTGTSYIKYQLRGASALAVVGVAACVHAENAIITKGNIAIGAAAPTPIIVQGATNILLGEKPTFKLFEEAGRIAASCVNPITDIRGSIEYRRELVKVLTKRALVNACNRANIEIYSD